MIKKAWKSFIIVFIPPKRPKNITGVLFSIEDHKAYTKELKSWLKACEESRKYSNQRFDYLVILLSSTGLIFVANLISYFHALKAQIPIGLVTFAIVMFTGCIMVNFYSQYIALQSSKREITLTRRKLADLRDDEIYYDEKYHTSQKRIDWIGRWIIWLNVFALVTLTLATYSVILLYIVGVRNIPE